MKYVTLAQAREYVGIEDRDRDVLLTVAVDAAESQVEAACGRRVFTLDTVASPRQLSPQGRVLHTGDGHELIIPDVGSATGLVVEYGSARLGWTDVTSLIDVRPADALSNGRPVTSLVFVGGRFPVGSGYLVRVTALWGWPEVPVVVPQAVLITSARLWKRRDSPEGIIGSSEWGAVRVGRVDPDVQALLRELRRDGGFA